MRSIITSIRNGFVVGAITVDDTTSVVFMASSGQTLRISMKDVRVMGRSTQGVRLVQLHAGDHLVAMQKLESVGDEEKVKAEADELQPEQE